MANPPPTSTIPLDDDAANPKFAASALDFLLIELVPLAQRITDQLHAREQLLLDEYKRSRLFHKSQQPSTKSTGTTTAAPSARQDTKSLEAAKRESTVSSEHASVRDSTAPGGEDEEGTAVTSLGFPVMDEKTREGVFFRLDGLGYRVGQGLVER